MSEANWPYQLKAQRKNMSQYTEISFPPVQIQTFHTDQKNSNEEHCSQPSRLITSLNLLGEKEYSKLRREKNFSQQDFHHRITYRWKNDGAHIHSVDCY